MLATAFMVFCMAVIGAITRLTESGLSMTEWRPLIGALPPLSETEWNRVFDLYKQIPEYQQVNSWMELSDFKQIFFWEWFHRLWGRLIGLVFAVPLIYFWVKGALAPWLKKRALLLLALGGLQGVMGWFMVMSGLTERTDVSHYRLATHLTLALLVYIVLLWTAFDIKYGRPSFNMSRFCLKRHGVISLALLIITVIWGAFVAGQNGGLIYNDWPLMGGALIPAEVNSLNALHANPAAAQFFHRWIAILSGLSIFTFGLRVKNHALLLMTLLQIGLGIATLHTQVHIGLAATHQAGAFVLCGLLIYALHSVFLNGCAKDKGGSKRNKKNTK